MGRKRNGFLGGGAGAILMGAWGVYSHLTTVRDLPEDAGWLAKMIADPPVYAPWLLFGACVIFLAWVFWHRETPIEEKDDSGPSTQGHGSHAFKIEGNNNTVQIAPPTPPNGSKQLAAKPRVWTEGGLDNLNRALSGHNPAPDLPLAGVLVRVYRALGGMPQDEDRKQNFRRRVNLAVADAVVENNLSVWGRVFDRPRQRIGISTWRTGCFDHQKQCLEVQGDGVRPLRYTDLTFNKAEVLEVWPHE